MIITSRAFKHEGLIPKEYTCNGEGINPPLLIEGIEDGVKSLVLIMEDIDSMSGVWDHWVKFNIPVQSDSFYIEEGEEPEGDAGKGTSGDLKYFGPCPQKGRHRYVVKVFALDGGLDLSEGASKTDVLEAMESHVVSQAELIGLYEQQ